MSASSSIHPASLIKASAHSTHLLELINTKLSQSFVEYLVDRIVETVDYSLGKPIPRINRPEVNDFIKFVNTVLYGAEVRIPTFLASLVYINRVKPYLRVPSEEWALERVFLGSLIVASKYTQDSTLKNGNWARCTGFFGKRDISRIEREFLAVLEFDLKISEKDILAHRHGILQAVRKEVQSFPSILMTRTPPTRGGSRVQTTPRNPHRVRPVVGADFSDSSSDSDTDSSSPPDSPLTPSEILLSEPATMKSNRIAPLRMTAKSSSSSIADILRCFPIPKSSHQYQNALAPRI